uniref:Uncharacterized protein n=1 Tax=Rhizophora mucronata TaxID=61149 RepID=A0A2P2JPJ0_RHIMU
MSLKFSPCSRAKLNLIFFGTLKLNVFMQAAPLYMLFFGQSMFPEIASTILFLA